MIMNKKMPSSQKLEYRYYEMPENELVLPLLGEDWIRPYGENIDYLHFHNFLEVGICHYGRGEVILNGKSFRFEDNGFVIIPDGIPHTTNADPETMAFWEWMYFDMRRVMEEVYPKDRISIKNLEYTAKEYSIYFQIEEQPDMARLIIAIRQEAEKKKHLYRESLKGLLQAFLIEWMRMCHMEERLNQRIEIHNVIAPAMEYVEQHFRENIRISQMAELCNVSESHFRRSFYEITNLNPLQFINLVRIQKACGMLKKTHYSMDIIASRCGFENTATFTRNFKRLLNQTPYQWKKAEGNSGGKEINYHINVKKGW